MIHKMFVIFLVLGLIPTSSSTFRANEVTHTAGSVTEQTMTMDEETGVITWSIKTSGVYFSIKQLTPLQIKAFYLKRGFTESQIEPYTQSCVFMTVLRNDSAPGPIHFVSKHWLIDINGKQHRPLMVHQWVDLLSKRGAKKSSLIAFRWAQFPIEQQYEPGGDWNQGMFSVGLSDGTKFSLIVKWDINGKSYQTTLKGVSCAK